MELDDIIISIGRILNNLEKIQEDKGVPDRNSSLIDKNITNSSLGKKKDVGSISSNEKKKLIEVFNLFNDSFFKYQQKQKPDEKQSTLISNIQKEQRPVSEKKEKSSNKGGILSSLADFLLPLVGGVALIGAAIPTIISALFEKVGLAKDAMKVLGKVGLIGGLKILAKTFLKKFALGALKKIPYLGGLISLTFAYQEFQAGRIIPGLFEIVSGLANFVPGVGPFLSIGVDLLKGFLEAKGSFNEGGSLSNANVWNTVKEWFSKAGDWISDNAMNLPLLGTFKRLSMSWDAFQSGNWGEGFKQFGIGILSLLGGSDWVEKGVNWMLAFFSGESNTEEATIQQGGIMGTVKGWMGSIGKFIKDNSLYMPIIGGIQRFGMSWDSFKNGDWGEGFKQLGLGLYTFIGGGPIIKGFEMMQDWFFGNQKEDEKSLSPDGSWKDRLKNWIKGKLNKLPAFLRKPLEWFGILDETGTEAGDNAKVETPKSGNTKDFTKPVEDEKKGFFSRMADSIGDGLSKIGDFAGNMFSSMKDIIKKSFDGLVGKISEILPEITKITQELRDKLSLTVQEIFKTLTPLITSAVTTIFDKLSSTVQDIFKTMGPIVTPMITTIFDKLSSTVQDIFKTVTPIVTPVITTIFDKLSSTVQEIFKTVTPAVTPIITTIFDKLSSTVQDIFKTVTPIVTPIITSIFDNLSSVLKEIFKTVTPIVTPMIVGAFDNLSSIIKNSNILSKDKYEILKSSKGSSNFENNQTDVQNIQNINVKNNDISSIGNIIETASSNQCKYLESLITLGNLSLKELKRMNGSSSSGGMVVAPPMINDSNRSMINMTDNRSGYAGSVYALA